MEKEEASDPSSLHNRDSLQPIPHKLTLLPKPDDTLLDTHFK